MRQKDIEELQNSSNYGDELILHIRESDMKKGITLNPNYKYQIVLYATISIKVEISDDVSVLQGNVKYILFSTDDEKKYMKTLLLKNYIIDNDNNHVLEFDQIDRNLNYSLKVEKNNESYFIFENIPYKDLR
jgi:hypothetical protein